MQALCRATRLGNPQADKLATFLANDFTTERWLSAARKNAYSLLSKSNFELAAAFFLLGDEVATAVRVCARQLGDLQLALVLCRLFSATAPEALRETVHDELLPDAQARVDPWGCCVSHMLLGEPDQALSALALRAEADGSAPATNFEPCIPAFYEYVVSNPRHRLPPQPIPTDVLLRSVHELGRLGSSLLAIETLQQGCQDRRTANGPISAHLSMRCIASYLDSHAVDLVRCTKAAATTSAALHCAMLALRDDAAVRVHPA